MTEYTPTTEEVRNDYRFSNKRPDICGKDFGFEFDRWLNEIRAEAWDECVTQMPLDLDWKNQYLGLNPYRPNEK